MRSEKPSFENNRKDYANSSTVFLCYDHGDREQVHHFQILRKEVNRYFETHNCAVRRYDKDGNERKIIYAPEDPRSEGVRSEILKRFIRTSKFVILIGSDTARSRWADWQIRAFYDGKNALDGSGDGTWKRIRGMRLKDHRDGEIPNALKDRSARVLNWNPEQLTLWFDEKNPADKEIRT